MTACHRHRERFLEYRAGELEGLHRAHVEAHLQACDLCRSAYAQIDDSFASVSGWEPNVDPAHLERLNDRLRPYLDEARPNRDWAFRVTLAAGLAAAAAVLFTVRSEAPIEVTPLEIANVKVPVVEVERRMPTPHLRVVSNKNWKGKVRRKTPTTTQVEMDDGFAVMAFEGGQGRKLFVKAPDVEIEVIGTRFYVEAQPGVPTRVGVVTGKVRVIPKRGKARVIEAGEAESFDASGARETPPGEVSKPFHSDAFLVEPPVASATPVPEPEPERVDRPEPKPRRVRPRVAVRKPAPPKLRTPDEVLSHAARLAKTGRRSAALVMLEGALARDDAEIEPYRALLRYERARILIGLGRRARGMQELVALSRGASEVARQASLAICETHYETKPCDARQCLQDNGSREARLLIKRWNLDQVDCDHPHKSDD